VTRELGGVWAFVEIALKRAKRNKNRRDGENKKDLGIIRILINQED
jgi:hypothetical protein